MSIQGYFDLRLIQLILVATSAFVSEQVVADTGMITAGATLFSNNCETCHGPNGNGSGPVAETMVLKPRDFALAAFKFDTDADWQRGTDADLRNVITQGTAVFGGSTLMPAWSHLDDADVNNLIAFIRSLEK